MDMRWNFIMLVLGICFQVQAQEIDYQFRNLSVENGLNHTDATCIGQDHTGFIWIGTYNGLNRFDGYELKSYRNNDQSANNVYANRIADLYIDAADRIWLGTEAGVACFDPRLESFIPLDHIDLDDPYLLTRNIKAIYYDSRGYVFTGGKNGIVVYQLINRRQLRYIPLDRKGLGIDGVCNNIDADSEGRIWFSTTKGMVCAQKQGDSFSFQPVALNQAGDQEVTDLAFTVAGDLAAATRNGVFVVDRHSISKLLEYGYRSGEGRYFPIPASEKWAHSIVIDHQSRLWLGMQNGIIQINTTQTQPAYKYYWEADQPDRYHLSSGNTTELFVDRDNGLWIGTFEGGVNYADLNQKAFFLMQRNSDQGDQTLSGNFIRALLEDRQGKLWIGTRSNGLDCFDPKTGRFSHFKYHPQDEAGLGSDNVRSLAEDRQGRIWVGTLQGISVLSADQKRFSHLRYDPSNPNSITDNIIFSMAQDKFGQMWAGSWNRGLNRIVESKDQFAVQRLYAGQGGGLTSNVITFVYADTLRPEVLAGSDNGLNRILLDDNGDILEIIQYKSLAGDSNALSSNFVWPVIRQNDTTLWVGTLGGGLNKITLLPKGRYRAEVFDIQSGAPSNDIESILMDDRGRLWLGGKGLSCFDPQTKRFTNYAAEDGLQGASFKIGAACKGAGGRMYFGGTRGLTYFYPAEIQSVDTDILPVLTDLIVNNETVRRGQQHHRHVLLPKALPYSEEVRLSNWENNFSIVFSGLAFANPNKCRYRYQLEGFDDGWITAAPGQRRATYSNLDYGSYRLRVAASNENGPWVEIPQSLKVVMLAPWWATAWAKFAYLLLVLGVISGVFYYFTRWYKLKKAYEFTLLEERQMEAMHQMRLQFFTNISHEFKTPLTLILNPLEKLLRQEEGERKRKRYYHIMYQNAQRLLRLIEELMDFRKAETGAYKLKGEKADISAFVEEIFEGFTESAVLKDIDLRFKSSGLIDNCWFDKNIVEKILYNVVSNAFKYTPAGGRIAIEVSEEYPENKMGLSGAFKIESDFPAQAFLWIKVQDTGIGIPEVQLRQVFDLYYRSEQPEAVSEGSGVGLALVKSLALLHCGRIHVYSETGKGTQFIVGLPKGAAHFQPDQLVSSTVRRTAGNNLILEDALPALEMHSGSVDLVQAATRNSILIVDDNVELLRFLRDSLSGQYTILMASNGKEGLEMVAKHRPDAIISDVMMPVMDGIQFCAAVKRDAATSGIPFILLSAQSAVEKRVAGIRSGADMYFPKPFSVDELEAIIENQLAARRQLKTQSLQDAFSEAREIVVEGEDKAFLLRLQEVIGAHLEDPEFDISKLSMAMGVSRTNLYNKVKELTDTSVGDIIRRQRLLKAAEIMSTENISMVQVMYRIGFQSQSHFTKAFKKEFGKSPLQFVKSLSGKNG